MWNGSGLLQGNFNSKKEKKICIKLHVYTYKIYNFTQICEDARQTGTADA